MALEGPVELFTWNLPFLEDYIKEWRSDFVSEYDNKYEFADPATKWTDRGPATEDILSYFQSRLQSGDPVNIFDTQMATYTRYAQDDVWVALDQFTDEEFLNKYYDKLIEVMTYEGSLLQMPFYMSTNATYSRTKWFDEAGIEPPTVKEFYSTMEYLDIAEQLVEKSEAEFGLTFIRYDWQIWPWFWSEGIDVLNEDQTKAAFNVEKTHEILSRFRELTESGVIPEVSWTGDWKPAAEQFGAGNTGMYFGSSSALRLIQNSGSDWVSEDTMGVAGSPSNERFGGFLTMHGLGVVKPNNSKAAQEASFDLISTILNKKGQKDFLRNTTVLVPHKQALKELRNDEKFISENPLLVQLYKLWDNVSSEVWVPPLVEASSQIAQTLDNEFSAAALGEKSVEEAIQSAERQVNSSL
ncbi:extracellular solute-binding protein [Halopelagius fulvigenes]|uniref:Extracellular solute-binding protein n=1 Tax=Halopelagius fulvigenes TaxID=1198324 RepID=A0ABD5TXU2_9EURY